MGSLYFLVFFFLYTYAYTLHIKLALFEAYDVQNPIGNVSVVHIG